MEPTVINARVVLDSVSPRGHRVTTFEVEYPRFILPEVLTHRVFNRNTASSRALPIRKMIDRVKLDPFVPTVFGRNQPGMQAGDEVDNPEMTKVLWLKSAMRAAREAEQMEATGVHKQIVNRMLEPYSWTKQIITATDYENFFTQRISPLAQPEMQDLALAMRDAYDASHVQRLDWHEWHMPYLRREDSEFAPWEQRRLSVARCARVSYLTHDGVRDPSKDFELYDRLSSDGHWSPFEHVCKPDPSLISAIPHCAPAEGNLVGFTQLRHLSEDQ